MEANSSQKGEEREAQTEKSRPTNVTQKSGAGLTVKSPKTLRKENRLFLHGRTPCAPTGVSHVPRAYYMFNPAGETKTSNFSFLSDRLLEGRDWAGLHPQTSLTPTLAQALCWAQGCRNNETLPCPQGHSKQMENCHRRVLCYRRRKEKGCGCQRPSITRLWENRRASRNRRHLSWVLRLSRSQTSGKEGKEGPSRRFGLSNVCITAITIIIPTLTEHLTMCQSLYLSTYTSINSFHPHKNLLRPLQLLFPFYK